MSNSSSTNPYSPGEVSKQKAPSGPIEYPGQQIKLSFVYDLKYLTEAVERFRVRRDVTINKPIGFLIRWWLPLLFIIYILFTVVTRRPGDYVTPYFFVAIGIIILFKRFLEKLILRRSFRSFPNLNQPYSITLTDEAYFSKSPLHDSKVMWTAFTDAIEFADGVLLSEGKQRYHWLPFKSLEDKDQSSILFRYVSSRLLADDQTPQIGPAAQTLNDSPVSNGDQIKVIIVYDRRYLFETLARMRKHHRVILWSIFRYVLAAILLCFGTLMLGTSNSWIAIPALMVAVALVFGRYLVDLKSARQLKSSPHNNEPLTITLSDGGCHVKSALQNAELVWSSFSEVVQFPGGVLLCRGKLHGVWIPYRYLENQSDSTRLYEFIASRIAGSNASTDSQISNSSQHPQSV